MAPSELDHRRASLWNILSTRRDIDSLIFELFGRHHLNQTAGSDAVDLACQLEQIFDLQRTHLQSRTPYGDPGSPASVDSSQDPILERLPYLLSLPAAREAVAFVGRSAAGYMDKYRGSKSNKVLLRRMIFVRVLVSGTRMLCLHPNVKVEDNSLSSLSLRIDDDFDLWEQVLIEACNSALRCVPKKHRGLQLPRMGCDRLMSPLNENDLFDAAERCTADFAADPYNNYWTMYDIAWSIVAAFIQCLAKGHAELDQLGDLADKIARLVMNEASRISRETPEPVILLIGVVEVLSPVLTNCLRQNKPQWLENYEGLLGEILNDRKSIFQVQDTESPPALQGFEITLMQRQLVLRGSSEELPTLLSQLRNVLQNPANVYSSPSQAALSAAELKLYVVNCDSAHIIPHNTLAHKLDEALSRGAYWNGGCLELPSGEMCPYCPLGARVYTRVREILPLSRALDIIAEKEKELGDLLRERQQNFLAIRPHTASTSPSLEHQDIPIRQAYGSMVPIGVVQGTYNGQAYTTPRNSSNGYNGYNGYFGGSALGIIDSPSLTRSGPVYLQTSPSSPLSNTALSPRRIGLSSLAKGLALGKRLAGASAGSASISSPRFDPVHIDLSQLGTGTKRVAVSGDCEQIFLWSKKRLGVYTCSGMNRQVLEIENSSLSVASKSYFATVTKESIHYMVKCYNLNPQFQPVWQAPLDLVQCLALCPKDNYLAIGKIGFVDLVQLRGGPSTITLDLKLEELQGVSAMSFSADGTELVVVVRFHEEISIFVYPIPLTITPAPIRRYRYLIGEKESLDQGVSSVVRCPAKDILCITSWTQSGVPVLIKKNGRNDFLDNPLASLRMGKRIQVADFSISGRFLVLIDESGTIAKVTADAAGKIEAKKIGKARRVARKSQFLDMKISDDEKLVRVAWVTGDENQLQAETILINLDE